MGQLLESVNEKASKEMPENLFLLFESSHANVEMLKELQVLNQATGEVNP
jgi:hypothetical protein